MEASTDVRASFGTVERQPVRNTFVRGFLPWMLPVFIVAVTPQAHVHVGSGTDPVSLECQLALRQTMRLGTDPHRDPPIFQPTMEEEDL